jgi:geranylgeranyl reductase family protein
MKVAVLGGGPAGAIAASQLAAAGVETLLFDEKLAWEKPCGGGLTWKAWSTYPFLIENDTPKKVITETILAAPKSKPATLKLDRPIVIYARHDLNGLLLDRAEKAGVQIEQTRVLGMDRTETGWSLRTKTGTATADFCIVATGARNPLRNAGTELTPADSMSALGYYVPGQQDKITIQFMPDLDGYIWIFPRCGHMSVGICGKSQTAAAMRVMLERYMAEVGLSKEGAGYYGHLLPSLETPAWKRNRVAGDGWLAVGDAAGLVDPITGEGIYYALRSGDLAAQSILSNPTNPEPTYRKHLRDEFTEDLEFASQLAHRFFNGNFLCGPITSRMVQFTSRSPKFRSVMQDLFAGIQPYNTLKSRLIRGFSRSIQEVAFSLFAIEES